MRAGRLDPLWSCAGPGRSSSGFLSLFLLLFPCLLGATALPLEAGEPSADEGKWIQECLKRLEARSDRARASAEAALVAMGPGAASLVVHAGMRWETGPARDAVHRVLIAWGRQVSAARVARLRDEARGASVRRLQAFLDAFATATPPALADPPGADLDAEEQVWARVALGRLGANSPREREGAERALVRLGPGVVPILVRGVDRLRSAAAAAGAARVLEALASKGAVAEHLRDLRRNLQGSAAETVDGWIELVGGASASGEPSDHVLQPTQDLSPDRVPYEAEREITDVVPVPFAPEPRAARIQGGVLRVDLDGDGTLETTVAPGAPRVLRFGPGPGRAVLLYEKRGRFFVCSASLLAGEVGGKPLLLWDVDLDGDFLGRPDLLSWDGGAFRPAGRERLLPLDQRILVFSIEGDPTAGWRVRVVQEPRPEEARPDQLRGLAALNAFRNEVGLAPLRLDAVRSRACQLHAAYLTRNAGAGDKVERAGAHTEDPTLPGYTQEGLLAGQNSNVGHGDIATSIVGMAATMLHRAPWLCTESERVGLGGSRGRGARTVIWTGAATASDRGAPIPVPAPGARRVPLRAKGEWPAPDEAPNVYGQPRGYPVSVTHRPLPLREVQVRLFGSDGRTPLQGRVFSPDRPIAASHASNGGTTFFLPEEPLWPGERYWAEWTAKDAAGHELRYTWSFRTD